MNKVIMMGRLVGEPYIGSNDKGKTARYTLAVGRGYKEQNGKEATDFPMCTCSGKMAEFAEKYLTKGIKIVVEGSMWTNSKKNDDGTWSNGSGVSVWKHFFCESKSDTTRAPENTGTNNGGANQDDDDELPF